MARKLHVYRPPRGRFTGIFAILGGVVATIAVFVAIPLSQKLSETLDPPVAPMPEVALEPPEDFSMELEEPPEEVEDTPPEEPMEEPANLDLGLDLGDLSVGTGGSFIVEIPKFALAGEDDPFGSGDLDSPPQPVTKSQPIYPNRLLSKGIGGKVVVAVTVNAEGKVASATIRDSSGNRDLDDAALKAVRKWTFRPAVSGGKKIQATALVPFNFEVKR
ncbi:protein TonB [Haloferula luteola]|uniref:Protein TonB n=1 Tax=Haloferula luteola TaxID=595692 RepID=A0A840V8K0_9BACT|nr:energy transducer TonB [Haloferula luteola]MBB5350280.1 protein TonB [Haloferula luteola]